MAFADKIDNADRNTYVIISEGEMYEGSIWESALFTSHHNLTNLVVIIDRNNKIILGDTEELVKLEPIDDKWKAFGFNVLRIDGHSHEEIINSLSEKNKKDKPILIIADTIKGKGISFMENVPNWHYWNKIDNETYNLAKKELDDEINKYE
tara:strand:+ start:3445 stop:3897 length:453 start_codon:yes stop_codon:yes gene_type:complete